MELSKDFFLVCSICSVGCYVIMAIMSSKFSMEIRWVGMVLIGPLLTFGWLGFLKGEPFTSLLAIFLMTMATGIGIFLAQIGRMNENCQRYSRKEKGLIGLGGFCLIAMFFSAIGASITKSYLLTGIIKWFILTGAAGFLVLSIVVGIVTCKYFEHGSRKD